MKDRTNQEWLDDLRGPDRDEAVADLRASLGRGLGYSLANHSDVDDVLIEDFAQDALLRILDNLDTFRGESRFTTWAQKIAVRVAFGVGIALGDEAVAAVLVSAAKNIKLGVGEGLSLLCSGVGLEELEEDLGIEIAKEIEGLWVGASQESAELVGLALDRTAQRFDEADLGQDLLGQSQVGFDAAVGIDVREEDACQESGVRDIGVSAA
jgi:hypothetical protein